MPDQHLARKLHQAMIMLATARETAEAAVLHKKHRDAIAQALELLAAELRANEESTILDGEVVT